MKKTLWIHIGHFKTGTTALQVFLEKNRELLLSADLDYSLSYLENSKHSALALSLLRLGGITELMHGYNSDIPPEVQWERLFESVRSSPASNCVISSEEFMRLAMTYDGQLALSRILVSGLDLNFKIVAYYRQPSSHLRAWFNQLVKMNIPIGDFRTAIARNFERIHLDYFFAIEPWVRIFGDDNVYVREYEGFRRGPQFIFQDFIGLIGLDMVKECVYPTGDPNPRIDDHELDLVRLMQNSAQPKPSISLAIKRFKGYRDRANWKSPPSDRELAALNGLVLMGLDRLASLPKNAIDFRSFDSGLNAILDVDYLASQDVVGFLLAEIMNLRKRVYALEQAELELRLAKIEELLKLDREKGA